MGTLDTQESTVRTILPRTAYSTSAKLDVIAADKITIQEQQRTVDSAQPLSNRSPAVVELDIVKKV